jgi:hypothetical protein
MAVNVKLAVYRGILADLAALASTGQSGVLAWTTDTNELYVDSGSGTGIGAGNAWLKVAQDLVAVNAQTGTTYTLAATDRSKLVTLTNAGSIAVTLPVATGAGFPAGFITKISNQGAGTATLTPTTSHINGAASLALLTGQSIDLVSDGTNYFALTGLTSFPVTSPVTHEYATGMNSAGVLSLAQPVVADVTGAAPLASPTFTGTVVLPSGQALIAPALGTPASGALTNCTGLPFAALTGLLTQAQLPASITLGSNLTLIDCGTF